MRSNIEKIWCIVPAAGIGSRMQAAIPKQYLKLSSTTILDATLERLLSCDDLNDIVVCIQPGDTYWQASVYSADERITVTNGGKERADSVLNGIRSIKHRAALNDWVLVHDAARPCVRCSDIALLIRAALGQQIGGILASPIHDTVKKVDHQLAVKTIDRSSLWRALTPQLFKLEELETALLLAKKQQQVVTDEASAIEKINRPVQIIEGHSDNIKITSQPDLNLARFYIQQQEKEACV